MSAQSNQTLLRRVIDEAFNQGKYQVLEEAFDPNYVEHQFGLHTTIPGLIGDIEYLRKAFPDFHLTIEDTISDGDKEWVRMTARGTNLGSLMGPPTGRSIEVTVFDEVRYKDGKIVEHWGSPDRFAQLSQLGLLPMPQAQPD